MIESLEKVEEGEAWHPAGFERMTFRLGDWHPIHCATTNA